MKAKSPTGSEIVGTLERLSGVAYTSPDRFQRLSDGSLYIEHAGETKVFWDGQATVRRNGKAIFVDDDGAEWNEDDVVVYDDAEAAT
jgi:hypothetical protein